MVLKNSLVAKPPNQPFPLHAKVFNRGVYDLSFTSIHKHGSAELGFLKVRMIAPQQVDVLRLDS